MLQFLRFIFLNHDKRNLNHRKSTWKSDLKGKRITEIWNSENLKESSLNYKFQTRFKINEQNRKYFL